MMGPDLWIVGWSIFMFSVFLVRYADKRHREKTKVVPYDHSWIEYELKVMESWEIRFELETGIKRPQAKPRPELPACDESANDQRIRERMPSNKDSMTFYQSKRKQTWDDIYEPRWKREGRPATDQEIVDDLNQRLSYLAAYHDSVTLEGDNRIIEVLARPTIPVRNPPPKNPRLIGDDKR